MSFYFKYIKPYLLYFIVGPILMITEVVGEVLMPRLMANIINIGVPADNIGYIVQMGLLMVGVALMMMGGGVGGNYFAAKASVSFAADLREDLYKKVQTFSFANLDHFQTAGGRIYQNHSYLFASSKRKVLPKKHGTHAGGTANGNRMETIRDPVIVRDGAEAGIDGIRSTINGDVDGKAVGGGI